MEESAGEKFRACVLGYYTRSSSVEQTELWLALVATDLFRGNVVRRANLHTDVRDGPYTSFAIDNSRVARFFTWTGISLIERNLRYTVLFRCDLETREFFFTRHRVEKRNNSLERIIRIIFLLLLIRPVHRSFNEKNNAFYFETFLKFDYQMISFFCSNKCSLK